MKWLLLLSVFLIGCLPVSPRDTSNATFRLEPRGDYINLSFNAGNADAFDVKIEIYAIPPRVNNPNCKIVDAHVECNIGTVPRGRIYELPATGAALTARASYSRGTVRYWLVIP